MLIGGLGMGFTLRAALARLPSDAEVAVAEIDRVFLTGGSSLIPRVRRIFTERFGDAAIMSGGELTSIAHGLALIGEQDDIAAWSA